MAANNKTTKKQTKSKRSAGKTMTPMKKTVRTKLAKGRVTPKKKLVQKKAGPKKSTVKRVQGKSQSVDTVAVAREGQGARAGEQSGDLQGLSNVAGADSESVDELLDEGNVFE